MADSYLDIDDYINESINLRNVLLRDAEFKNNIRQAILLIKDCFKKNNKILVAGNGGSAADAQHFTAELVGRYKRERKAYPVIALTTHTSILTAWSNDYDFNTVFRRQIEALGAPNDIFLGISTSGNSKNVIEGVKKAKLKGLQTICLLGRDGGAVKNEAGISIIVPSDNTPRIQEVHIMVLHMICEEVEKALES